MLMREVLNQAINQKCIFARRMNTYQDPDPQVCHSLTRLLQIIERGNWEWERGIERAVLTMLRVFLDGTNCIPLLSSKLIF